MYRYRNVLYAYNHITTKKFCDIYKLKENFVGFDYDLLRNIPLKGLGKINNVITI